VSLGQLAESLRLSRYDGVPNPARRLERRLMAMPKRADDLADFLQRSIATDADSAATDGVCTSRARATNRPKATNEIRQSGAAKQKKSDTHQPRVGVTANSSSRLKRGRMSAIRMRSRNPRDATISVRLSPVT
jgi:hypothetical protein